MMISFLRANKNDCKELRVLAEEIWRDCYPGIITCEQIEYMLPLMYGENIIAEEIESGTIWDFVDVDNSRAGFISYYPDKNENRIKLSKLYIRRSFHGSGAGGAALRRVVTFARSNLFAGVYLQVNRNNLRAITAYKKEGFTVEKELATDIGNGYIMDDYIMSCGVKS